MIFVWVYGGSLGFIEGVRVFVRVALGFQGFSQRILGLIEGLWKTWRNSVLEDRTADSLRVIASQRHLDSDKSSRTTLGGTCGVGQKN